MGEKGGKRKKKERKKRDHDKLSCAQEHRPAPPCILGSSRNYRPTSTLTEFHNPYHFMPGRPHEWCWTILSICLIGIDALTFQKHLYYPLMPVRCRPRDWPQSVSTWSGLTPSCSNSIFTIPSCPFPAAHGIGVRPRKLSDSSGLARPHPKSILTIPSWPRSAAHKIGADVYADHDTTAHEQKKSMETPLPRDFTSTILSPTQRIPVKWQRTLRLPLPTVQDWLTPILGYLKSLWTILCQDRYCQTRGVRRLFKRPNTQFIGTLYPPRNHPHTHIAPIIKEDIKKSNGN